MRVQLCFDSRTLERWHIALLERLNHRPGIVATAEILRGQGGLSRKAALLLRLDALLYRTKRVITAPAAPAELAPFRHQPGAGVDLVLDLSGAAPATAARVWRLTYDGAAGESALLNILLDGRVPVAAITEADRTVAIGRIGAELNGSVLSAFEDSLSRTGTLIEAALAGTATALPAQPPGEPPANDRSTLTARRLGAAAARQIFWSTVRHAYRFCFASPHWRVGWRRLDGPDLFDLRHHPGSGWHTLPDDRLRFYADPFPIEHDGAVTLFVEEFAHKGGKGIISAVTFGPDGPLGRPEPVLERPYHLSYPFVFAGDGEVWMIPESCAAGTIDLFRATRFPGGWVKEATLVSDIVASDATLVEHGGKWWMFATVRGAVGAFSDALHLWSAPDFRGPWTPHPGNPVMIDIASARPAGRIVQRDGVLFRPVQDCRRGYGVALGIARILRLDETGFEQVVETNLTTGPDWPGNRMHTLNSAGGFEFIDGSARVRRRF